MASGPLTVGKLLSPFGVPFSLRSQKCFCSLRGVIKQECRAQEHGPRSPSPKETLHKGVRQRDLRQQLGMCSFIRSTHFLMNTPAAYFSIPGPFQTLLWQQERAQAVGTLAGKQG